MANLESSVPATFGAIYLLGSITKMFTATAVMLLVEEDKIELDKPFVNYMKDLSLPAQVGHITLRQLLNHTSGIIDFTDIPGSIQFARMDRLRQANLALESAALAWFS
jgi:CubicO group peptidase (beta-lactamase class C family)